MPKQVPELELEAIADVVSSRPGGSRVEDIRTGLSLTLTDRTLQRRLKQLADEGRIRYVGNKKGRRYFPAKPSARGVQAHSSKKTALNPRGEGLPLSAEARDVRELVCRPATARQPVGYSRAFLDAYEPNVSSYLTQKQRDALAIIGEVGLGELPAGTYLRRVLDRLLIDLSWNSSRLEGNTYSLLETQRLLELGESAEGKTALDAQMLINHKAAIEMLADQAEGIGFNRYTICNLHALLSDNLLADPTACGRLRSRAVGIGGTVFHPLENPQQLEECFLRILEKASAIEDRFEQAFFVMVQLPYLQPFEDVNKRVSRLAANIPLVKHNLCPLSFVDVPKEDYVDGLIGVYELNRIEYLRDVFVWAYERSAARYSAIRQSLGEPDPFRLRHRAQIGEFVRHVVQNTMGKAEAANWIARHTEEAVEAPDQPRFVEVVEVELDSLHEGNIARYKLRPAEFVRWQRDWQ